MGTKESEQGIHSQVVLLEEIKAARAAGASLSELWGKMHSLAESQSGPALSFFRELLEDPEWDWRQDATAFLGFHYDLRSHIEIIDRIRELAITDPEPMVRSTAVAVIGIRSQWPDHTLLNALVDDPDQSIRKSAFEALLKQAEISRRTLLEIGRELDANTFQPTKEDLRRILRSHGKDLEIP